ncbi:hypothetical protein [Anaerocolumna sp. MB42-C2]|uniref:hypothetical protein n=1 Tax=Anaerocolumna sp. MB42-C2 TaxID=3070997 RepID=UPI0027E1276E|nr:hypothetical protein [Anaerocolumna sp. MB42-C2]WMJ88317.1 hypothetical protein RBU59_02060 [Anaerocolumna sp. MB42-C2]
MRHNYMKRILLITTFSLFIAANGCSLKSDKQILGNTNNDGKQTIENIQSVDKDVLTKESNTDETTKSQDSDSVESTKEDSETVERVATKEVSIYTINENTQGVESVVALVPEGNEINPQLIIDLVTDSLADRLITVGIDSVETKQDTVIVNFKSDQPPLTNVGSGMEKTILDAIAQSLVDNLPEYPKVIFRVEGHAYESGHLAYGLDEVYLDNSKSK